MQTISKHAWERRLQENPALARRLRVHAIFPMVRSDHPHSVPGGFSIRFFWTIFSAKTASFQAFWATLCLYLIIGVLWAQIYLLLETLSPGSFTGKLLSPENPPWVQLLEFVCFSFITLTTLGYGSHFQLL